MTNGTLFLIVLIVLVVGSILWDCQRSRRLFCVPLPRLYRDRQSQLAAWKRACSDDVMDKVDHLLRILCESFSFNLDDRYQFAPTDRIMDVYRSCYPRWMFWRIADAMEIESLTMDLQRRFQLNDAELSEMTLAEVVELIKSP